MRLQFVLFLCVCLSLTCVSLAGTSLISNGDFEAGNTAFYSAYEDHTDDPASNRLDGGARYMVRHSWAEGHPDWYTFAYGDHTSGSGLMYIANGATDQRVVWRQDNISVVPGRDYTFSYFLGSGGSDKSPAQIEASINGQVLGTATQPTTLCLWFGISYSWNSGSSTTASVSLRDLCTGWVGNDFTLDDISLTLANGAPSAYAGEDMAINSADQSVTTIQGTASDPDEDALQYRWLEGDVVLATWANVVNGAAPLDLGAVPAMTLGDHVLTLEVSDGTATGSDTMTLTLLNTPPVGVLNPASLTVELGSGFTIQATAADFDGDLLAYQWGEGFEVLGSGTIDAPDDGSPVDVPPLVIGADDPRFGLGVHMIDLVLDDPANGPVTTTATVTVEDSTEPTLAPVSSESILWPPNHQLRPITITANASDNGGVVTLAATVQSNEPQEDGGDGSTDQDWTTPVIDDEAGTIDVSLRAERSGSGEGRIYTITITATDQSGNASVATVEVRVPHDRRNK